MKNVNVKFYNHSGTKIIVKNAEDGHEALHAAHNFCEEINKKYGFMLGWAPEEIVPAGDPEGIYIISINFTDDDAKTV